MIMFVSFGFLIKLTTFSDVIINLGGMLIIGDFDNIFGKIFMINLKTYHKDITLSENFMKFHDI